jgi:triose/dihydroxyacetone kinase / FAD-AMP lyase (cyclizing)
VAVIVNNLGATTEMELAIVARHAASFLAQQKFTVERIYAGTYLSSLDVAGISISVLGLNDERLRWLDAPTAAPAWPNAARQRPGNPGREVAVGVSTAADSASGAHTEAGRRNRKAIEAACRAMLAAESELTEMDRITGDGDLGVSMARGAKAVQEALAGYPLDNTAATISALGNTLRRALGGSSGPLYGVLFLRCGNVLAAGGASGVAEWTGALDQGCAAISELGGAKPGDRTMLDAIDPFVRTLRQAVSSSQSMRDVVLGAVEAAERGAEATAAMRPKLGRSSYLGVRVLGHPDPGAKAIAMWLRAACQAVFSH